MRKVYCIFRVYENKFIVDGWSSTDGTAKLDYVIYPPKNTYFSSIKKAQAYLINNFDIIEQDYIINPVYVSSSREINLI